MSVTTSADLARDRAKEKIEEAKRAIKEAQEAMEEMVDPETWGGNEWNDSFISEVEEAIASCLTVRTELRKIANKL